MPDSSSRLTPLQADLLEAFFARTERFFLTGGAALAAYYLHHRSTKDLDIFGPADADLEAGVRALRAAAAEVGGNVSVLQDSPDFRRLTVARGDELTVVDLVVDRAPQLIAEKPTFGRVRVDAAREIAANKLCALLGRIAPRDLFDLKLLLATGLDLAQVLADAQRKDGGVDPATLAWVLSDWRLGPRTPLPEEASLEELETFRVELIDWLLRRALPAEPPARD